MRNFLIIILIFCINFVIYAQLSNYKVTYQCFTNIGSGKAHDGLNTLYYDSEKSLYIHNDWPLEDSYKEIGAGMSFIKGDKEGMPVFINQKDSQIIYKTAYKANPNKGCIILIETMPKIKWVIQKETKKIGIYDCVMATGEFGNRIYDVWFTFAIPVALGPYKLCGLPGLILEANSRDNRVNYKFVGLESTKSNAVILEKPKNGKLMTQKQFEDYVVDDLLRVEAMSTSEVKMTNNDPPTDFEIEKDKFTIISNYKRKRDKNRH